jgi:hypothetical protein
MKKNVKKCKNLLTFQKLCIYNIIRKAKAELNLKKLNLLQLICKTKVKALKLKNNI